MPIIDAKCKICRRAGVKLFLKGEKCLSPKCPMLKKSYPPGNRKKRRNVPLSEFGKELREKQKLKNWYNLGERQFRNYVRSVFKERAKVEDTTNLLIQKLESRLDNVVFRMGLAKSHIQARHLVSHGHFQVNGRKATIPSRHLKKGDKISVRTSSQSKKIFEEAKAYLKKYQPPSWLKVSPSKLEGEVTGFPNLEEAAPPAEVTAVFEFYSR